MSFAKYAQFYKENGFFVGSKIKATVTDSSFIGQELVLTKGSSVIRSTTIPASGKVDFFTDESGVLTLSSNNGTSIISGTVNVTNYATYNVTLEGASTDKSRQVYASKNSVTLDATHSSDTVSISYTGDKSNLSVTSSNPNVATATINNATVTINDAGKGFKGSSNVTVTVAATQKYNAKSINISVEKTNGQIDKSWTGLKNIVESGLEEELCEVGEEFTVQLSNADSITFIIAAINHDYDHQIIFVPKRYDEFVKRTFGGGSTTRPYWKNCTMRTYLNGTFFDMLPNDLREAISSKTNQIAISSKLESVTDKIWLPRETEILGKVVNAYSNESDIYRIHQFKAFEDELVVLGDSNYSNKNMICLISDSKSGTGNVVSAHNNNSSQAGTDYITNSESTSYEGWMFPCFHIIKET